MGSEMCIRDRLNINTKTTANILPRVKNLTGVSVPDDIGEVSTSSESESEYQGKGCRFFGVLSLNSFSAGKSA